MRKLLVVVALASTSSAWAQLRCLDKLLPIPRPSASHQLASGEWTPGTSETMTTADAERALRSLLFGKLLCREGEVEFKGTSVCAPVDATAPESHTCYVPANIGHFILTQDYGKNANVIFQRTKRARND